MTAPEIRIVQGHVIDKLRELPDRSVHCVVTSPPYWGLRDYSRCECAVTTMTHPHGGPPASNADEGGHAFTKDPDPNCTKCHGTGRGASLEVVWDAAETCEHDWVMDEVKAEATENVRWQHVTGGASHSNRYSNLPDPRAAVEGDRVFTRVPRGFCRKCGAWRGQLGLEPTPSLYVDHIVQVFREMRRVLRDDGTLWLNMGDCYNSSNGYSRAKDGWFREGRIGGSADKKKIDALKPKDLVGMPWRVAFALQADGWWLRSDIVWAKPNPMPESITDRPTKAHEYVFLLTKNARYFYDAEAVRKQGVPKSESRYDYPFTAAPEGVELSRKRPAGKRDFDGGRNLRTVWTIPTQAYPEAHFATFPEALVEPCIKAGTSEKGCCVTCGAAWERIVELSESYRKYLGKGWHDHEEDAAMGMGHQVRQLGSPQNRLRSETGIDFKDTRTVGFSRPCDHSGDPIPCIVLDPFAGSGTVGAVARSLGRSAILIEIKEQYVALARQRARTDLSTLDAFGAFGAAP